MTMTELTPAEIDAVFGGAWIFVEKYDKFGEVFLCPVEVSDFEAAMKGGYA